MTFYRLKDKERQAALEKALPGFSARFQKACSDQLRTSSAIYVTGDEHVWAVLIPADEIEKVQEYDPKKWNKWPDVAPPENVIMRVMQYRYDKQGVYGCSVWKRCDDNIHDGAWWAVTAGEADEIEPDMFEPGFSLLYRPWDD